MPLKEIPPLTTHEISKALQVDLTTVINWCEQGKLPAYKTPGGHRRIQYQKFLGFLEEYHLPIPQKFLNTNKTTSNLLIVDDEDGVRRVVLRALKKQYPEYTIYEAHDGFAAGKLVSETLPDLVILDLKLPGVDGFKVCSNIKKDDRLKHTKILAVTGQNTPHIKQRILESGADDYLPKPFDLRDLLAKANSLLNKKKVGSLGEAA